MRKLAGHQAVKVTVGIDGERDRVLPKHLSSTEWVKFLDSWYAGSTRQVHTRAVSRILMRTGSTG